MKSFNLAYKNLVRNKRRTVLTSLLIGIGVVFVLLFSIFSGSFKNYMISQITDSMLGHLQIHKKGYVAALDTMPLDKNLNDKAVKQIETILSDMPQVESISKRLKIGAMISNYEKSTNVRLNGIIPADEHQTMPLLKNRVEGNADFKSGEILIPRLVATGMDLKIGDSVVLVVSNLQGSVNAKPFKIAGIVEPLSGPGGRDGYIHLKDSQELLRVKNQINEIAVRLKNINALPKVNKALQQYIKTNDKPKIEVHPWQKLSPFSSIANMIDLMSLSVKIILIAIVLVSILNVMIMSVYERIKEIGTMSAIGTKASFIRMLFINEGLLLGIFGLICGFIISTLVVLGIGDVTFAFGRQDDLVLTPQFVPVDFIVISVLVIIISVLASLYPAFKASNMNPVDALRK
jgi:putative ABC transport system permease protein